MNEQLGRLENVYHRVLHESRKLSFSRRHPQQLYAACLHAALLAQLSSCLGLLKKVEFTPVPGILRDLLETYADLVNLCRCPEYVVRLQASFLARQGKVLQLADRPGGATNPVVRKLAGNLTPAQAYGRIAERLAEYERYGLGLLGTRERFERAGLATLHDSVYALLALYSPNNLNDLPERWLDETESEHKLAGLKAWQSDLLETFLHTLAGVVVDSYRRVSRLSPKPQNDGLSQVAQALKQYMSGMGRRAA